MFPPPSRKAVQPGSFRPLAGCGLFPDADEKVTFKWVFPSPCGVWVVSERFCIPYRTVEEFPSPCGVWVVSQIQEECQMKNLFPSPCGVWVVSADDRHDKPDTAVSVPLRGVGCFQNRRSRTRTERVSVPLRGVGCFRDGADRPQMVCVSVPLRGVGCFSYGKLRGWCDKFPSPCGVWVVSYNRHTGRTKWMFPSPCGVWVVSRDNMETKELITGFRPLAGCGLFRQSCTFFLVQQEKELSTLLFYCIILADVYQ